jgi:ribose 5-phosphate isomerase A
VTNGELTAPLILERGVGEAIDGAEQVAPSGRLLKGGGAAHTHEKAVAAAADRFVVIVPSNQLTEHVSPPVPLELWSSVSLPPSPAWRRCGGGPSHQPRRRHHRGLHRCL